MGKTLGKPGLVGLVLGCTFLLGSWVGIPIVENYKARAAEVEKDNELSKRYTGQANFYSKCSFGSYCLGAGICLVSLADRGKRSG
tara:strand:+ start:4551 stop:4805 length:255 start_codon:yes stop_codon:yes gene_type:complete